MHRAVPAREVEVARAKAGDLRDAAAGRVKRFERRPIAAAHACLACRRIEQTLDGRGREHRRQTIPDRWSDQKLDHVLRQPALEDQEAEERREARQMATYAGGGQSRQRKRLDVSA